MDLDLEALAVNVGDLKGEGFVEPESQARDGGEGDLSGPGCGSLEEPSNLLDTEDGGEAVCGVSPNQRQGVPVVLADMLREESDGTGANAHGSWGETIDVFAVQEVGLKLRFGDHAGGCAVELRKQTYLPDLGLWGTLSRATELESRQQLLTQRGHARSPCLH